jgi:cobalt-zinc-cadmium efflux system membrane fusion protein
MKARFVRAPLASTLTALCLAGLAAAHEGDDHAAAPGTEAAAHAHDGPIEVSGLAQRNLGMVLVEVELAPIETTLRAFGEIQADPARSGTVASRIEGRIAAVFAQEGERVEKGQALVEVESRRLGDPPPRVRYGSPVGGTVIDRHVVLGDDVEPSRHLIEVADLREVLAVGRIFEDQIGQVSIGQNVRVRVPSYPEDVFDGIVERLAGKLDPTSRSLPVFIRVPNPDLRLRPHMRAVLSLVTGGAELALVIPKAAVLGDSGELYAFVQDEDRPERFERRPIVLGIANDAHVEVIEGLSPGERVVAQGGYALQYVTPASEDEPEATAASSLEHDANAEREARIGAHRHGPGPVAWAAGAVTFAIAAGLLYGLRRARSRAAPEGR